MKTKFIFMGLFISVLSTAVHSQCNSALDWYNTQFPANATICQSSSMTAYGKVYEAGVTNLSGQAPGLTASIGWSSTNSNPSTWTNWQNASFNVQVGNDDEFVATFGSNLPAGTYYYAFRYQYNGCSPVYGGLNGPWNGTTSTSGVLTVLPIPFASSTNGSQTICLGSSLSMLFTVSNAQTANVVGLPQGVSYSFTGSSITISGTPTQSGNFPFQVMLNSGQCTANYAGNILVNSPLDWYNLQFPASASICTGGSATVYGQVYEPGLTTTAGQGNGLSAQIGYSTSNSNPNTWTNWLSAQYNPLQSFNPNNDEFMATFGSNLSPGTYYYTMRYAVTGCPFVYGGYNANGGGPWNGTTNVSGVLNVGFTTSVSQTNITCNGSSTGAIDLTVNGAGPYTYSWTGPNGFSATTQDINNLLAGTYTVVVTGPNNCTSTSTLVLTQPAAITASVSSSVPNATICTGGSTTLSAAIGSSGSVSYQWQYQDNNGNWINIGSVSTAIAPIIVNQNASPSATRSYRIRVWNASNPGCVTIASQLVTVYADPVVSITGQNISCFGASNGSATATISGGIPGMNYTFNWFSDDNISSNNNPTGDGTLNISGLFPTSWVIQASGQYGCYVQSAVQITQPAALNVAANSTGIQCNGGSAIVTVGATGGTTPYQGTGSFTVGAGNYTHTVVDANGCTGSTSVSIIQPAALSMVATTSSNYNGFGVSCFGAADGSATSIATGGTGSISYAWNNGSSGSAIAGLPAGVYTVVATDANGCTISSNVTISQPTKVNISATNTAILCNGNNADVTVDTWGGVTPYVVDDEGNYSVTAGTYTYNVVDANGCSASTTLTITEPAQLTVDAGGDEIVFVGYGPMSCANLDADVSGGSPAYGVTWTSTNSGGGIGETLTACPTTNDVYTVTVTDANGCTATDDLSICVVDVTCYAGNSSIQKVQMCQIPPGNPGNAHTICIDENAVPAHLAIGCVLGECGELEAACGNASAKSVDVSLPQAALTVAPNPTNGNTKVSITMTTAGDYNLLLFDMMGKAVQTVYSGRLNGMENQVFDVDMSAMQNGMYILGVSNGEQSIQQVRVVKQ